MEDKTPELIALPLVPIIDESIIPEKAPTPNDPLDQQYPFVSLQAQIPSRIVPNHLKS